jgi:hypothetical protein
MAKYVIDSSTLTAIGDSIRAKKGTSANIAPENMPSEISGITTASDYAIEDGLVKNSLESYQNERVTTIGVGAFYHSYAKTLDFPNVESIGQWAFFRAKSESILCPKAKSMGYEAFYYADRLLEIDLPLMASVPGDGFLYCSKLQRAKLDSCTSLGDLAFAYCSALTDVYIPLVTSIGTSGFYGCSIAKLDLPACASIGKGAFSTCRSLGTLILRSPTVCTLIDSSAFSLTLIASGTGYIYVPAALVDTYKAATNWSTYASQIRAIEDYPEITGG